MGKMTDEELEALVDDTLGEMVIDQIVQKVGPFARKFIKPAILPTVGGIAGAAFGGGLGTPFGMTVPGGVAGSAAGSALGESANQLLGITEPSATNIALSGAIPAAVGTVGAGLRAVRPFMTAGRAAQTLNALAPDEAASRLATLKPSVPASVLFRQATGQQVQIPMNRTVGAVSDMLDDLGRTALGKRANATVMSALKAFKEKLNAVGGRLSPADLQAELEGSGSLVAALKARGGAGSGAAKKVFQAMVNDLDDAAKLANPHQAAARTLIAARDAFKRESVLKEIGEAITDATKVTRGQGGNVQFNPSAVLREIGKNRFYKDALTAAERADIEKTLKVLNKIPALRPGAGQTFGSGQAAQFGGGGVAGGLISLTQGGSPEAIAQGALIGAGVVGAAKFGQNVATALSLKTGRALMRELLTQSKGIATPQVMSIIAAYATAVRGGNVSE